MVELPKYLDIGGYYDHVEWAKRELLDGTIKRLLDIIIS